MNNEIQHLKILLFTHFYSPESIAAAFRAADHSKFWRECGNKVTVFTGYPNYPIGRIYDGYVPKLLSEEKLDGIHIFRSKLYSAPNTSIINRLKNALSFLFFGVVNLVVHNRKIGKDYDVVLGTSGDVFTALLAWIYTVMHRKPFVMELRDITYRQMQATGGGRNSLSVRVMRFLELFLCKRAKKVVVVTEGFKKILSEDGIPTDKIAVITNGVDVQPVDTSQIDPNHFVLSYFGTLGISQNVADTFPYANVIREFCKYFTYLIIGEGAQRKQIEDVVSGNAFPYIELMHGMSASDLEAYYTKSLMSVITLRKTDDFRYTLPSKLFQVMGRGLAVLFIGPDGEAAEIVRKYHAGLALTGTFEEDMVTLRCFFSQEDWQEQLIQMGKNGALAVSEHYSRRNLAQEYVQLLEECVHGTALKIR